MGKSCVAGAGEIAVDERALQMRAGTSLQRRRLDYDRRLYRPGVEGQEEAAPPDPENLAKLAQFMSWVEPYRTMGVRANADIRAMPRRRASSARGHRTVPHEHMFFAQDRIPHMRAMILTTTKKTAALRSRNCCPCSAPISLAV